MEPEFWKKKWQENDIAFHQASYNRHLTKSFAEIPPGVVLVPLCGKSRDMDWLRRQGHQVIGAELSALACESFFTESGEPYTEKKAGDFTLYQGNGITIYCGDFFQLTKETVSQVTAVYDRAALIALPEALRARYAKHVQTLVEGRNVPILLLTVEYDQAAANGPPFSVSREEVERLYATGHKIEILSQAALDPALLPLKLRPLARVGEGVYWIR